MKFDDEGCVTTDEGIVLEVEDLLSQLAVEVMEDSQRWFGTQDETDHHSLENIALCLVGEVGELCNYVKKLNRGDAATEEFLADMDEEAVDAFIYLLKYAAFRDLDLFDGYLKKREKNARRFGRQGAHGAAGNTLAGDDLLLPLSGSDRRTGHSSPVPDHIRRGLEVDEASGE
jgi:NTP pyrophosphatase (non-canonical NTP hydrolase)